MDIHSLVGRSRGRAVCTLLLVAFLWSLSGILIKSVQWSSFGIAGSRSLIAALVLLPLVGYPIMPRGRREVFAALLYAGTLLTFVFATKLTTAANAILLQYTAPIHVAILSHFFLRERLRGIDIISIIAVLVGMVLFFLDGISIAGMTGNIIAMVSGFLFATMVVCLRSLRDISPLRPVFWGNVILFIVSLPFMTLPLPDATGWFWILILGVVQIALPYYLFTIAIRYVTATDGVLVTTLEPILNPIWVMIGLGEVPGPWALIGATVVVGSIVMRAIIPTRA